MLYFQELEAAAVGYRNAMVSAFIACRVVDLILRRLLLSHDVV